MNDDEFCPTCGAMSHADCVSAERKRIARLVAGLETHRFPDIAPSEVARRIREEDWVDYFLVQEQRSAADQLSQNPAGQAEGHEVEARRGGDSQDSALLSAG